LSQHESAAPAANIKPSPRRYAVMVEVTVQAKSADEAAQVVRGCLTDVFAPTEHAVSNVYTGNTEPPGDDTWDRALHCAGALG
jgi:hypothetical protein